MRKFCIALGGLLVASVMTVLAPSAFADGYAYGGGIKDGPRPFSWTGFYVGVQAGIGTGQTTADLGLGGLFNTDFDMSGGIYGGQIGYNWQRGATVLGIEASYSGTSIQGNTSCLVFFDCKREVESVGTVVGRLGLAMDRSLVYAMGGVAWGKVQSDLSIFGLNVASDSQTHVGWVAGVGFEHAVSNNLSLRIEYSHIDLGRESYFGGAANIDVKLDTVRLGANYKFN